MKVAYSCSLLIAMLVSAATPHAAIAVEFVPAANPGNLTLDLDSAGGKYSWWRTTDLSSINAIRTSFQALRLGYDLRWAPGYGIRISAGEETVLLEIVANRRQSPLEIHLVHYVGKDATQDWKFATPVDLQDKIDIALDWDVSGRVTVKLGNGESKTMNLGHCPTAIEIETSTGEGKFDPLSLGRTPSPVCSAPAA